MIISLAPIDPTGLNIFSNDRDILRDLVTYLDYIDEHSIKRLTRSNEIPLADLTRIARFLDTTISDFPDGGTQWINFIDNLAYDLSLITYDRKGKYLGRSSSSPSFLENFITINNTNYKIFLDLTPAAQEKQILESLVGFQSTGKSTFNELEHQCILAHLDNMHIYNSHFDQVNFPHVRQFLLKILENCSPGIWYSTTSLIAYLKTDHPYFLLPKILPKKDRWGEPTTRYMGFREGENYWQSREFISDDAPDAFERVEGRYVERFLEHIPLLMRFVDVAYECKPDKIQYPSLGMLKAFRVNERFLCLISAEPAPPKITVQPNFDVVVESDFYPAGIIHQIAALGEQMSNPSSGHGAYVGIFQLKKTAVAAAHVHRPDLNVVALLKDLGGRDLPPNVQIELEEWAGHADQFTLYEGLSILESVDHVPDADEFTIEHITPHLRLVRNAETLFSTLETLGYVPSRIQHPSKEFKLVAETAASIFPKESTQNKATKTARQVKVSSVVTISYQFPDEESFDSIRKVLAEMRCPFQSDPKNHIVSLQQKDQVKFNEAAERLQDAFSIEIV